jgi:DNA-binding transcriptional LysR family regulator
MKHLIESRQIRAFVAVARRGSFTNGAKDIFLTQSAVSHAVKSMEADLGCHLFKKAGKQAVLTETGVRLLQHCEEILQKMQETREDLNQLPRAGTVSPRIGAPMTVYRHIIPSVLQSVQQEFPNNTLRIETGDSTQLLAQLLAGRVDLAIMVEPEKRPEFAFETLFSDELHFLMLPSHPWAALEEVTAAHIERATLILPNNTTRTHQMIASYLRARHIAVGKSVELGSVESIKELVKNGLGVGVGSQWPVRAELQSGELVSRPLGIKPLGRQWQIVRLRGRPLNAVENSFVRSFREASGKLAAWSAPSMSRRTGEFGMATSALAVG